MFFWFETIDIHKEHKLLHTAKFTCTNNGCCAPNAGLQLSCPMCMASLCEPNICYTSASKPGGGKRGRLGGSLQSHLKYCSCINNNCPTSPAAASISCCCRVGKQHHVVRAGTKQQPLIRLANPLRFSGPARPKRWQEKQKVKIKYVSPTWRASCIRCVTMVMNSEFVPDPQSLQKE